MAGAIQVPADQDEGVEAWWNRSMEHLNQAQKRSVAAILSYTTWNIWKQCNARVLRAVATSHSQLLRLIKRERDEWIAACAHHLGCLFCE